MHRSLGSALMSVVMTVAGAAMLGVAGYSLLSGQSLCSMATGGACEAKASAAATLPAGHSDGDCGSCPLTASSVKQVASSEHSHGGHSHSHGGHSHSHCAHVSHCPTALLANATEAEAVNAPVEVLGSGLAIVMPAALYVDSSIDRSNLSSKGDCSSKSECAKKSDCGDKSACDKSKKEDCSEKSNCGDKGGDDGKKTACNHDGGDDGKKTACKHDGGDDGKKAVLMACNHDGGDDDKKSA